MTRESWVVEVVGAAIVREGRCLVTQRGTGVSNAGEWELPGGKVEVGESHSMALEREIFEELGLRIRVGEYLGEGTAKVGEREIVLHAYFASILSGTLCLREHRRADWLGPDELGHLGWSAADRPLVGPLALRLSTMHGRVH